MDEQPKIEEWGDALEELLRLRDVDLERIAMLERRIAALEAAAGARWWHRPARWARWLAGAPA